MQKRLVPTDITGLYCACWTNPILLVKKEKCVNKGSSKQSFEVFRRVGAAVNATFYTQFLDLD
ncbi:hypothetical protein, partial [Chlorobaculum sp. 24CR]|uniref:hypothetical protein n=1 Tax=Chlorobaculum sp. 24CR TaxID=2508878 RepID=UPI001ADC328B